MAGFTHIDERGAAAMVDVSEKQKTLRRAVASGSIRMSRECFLAVLEGEVKKGDVLSAARIAGIMGVKKTSELIPLCHPLSITKCGVVFELVHETCEIKVMCTAECVGRTGVEMEALTGASAALLTIYDMCKAIDRRMEITNIRLEEKQGGKSGHFLREREDKA